MAVKFTDTKYYQEIADAIRAKNGTSDTYTPPQMGAAIEALPTGGDQLIAYLNHEKVNVESSEVTRLYDYALNGATIGKLKLPNCTSAGYSSATYSSIDELDMPALQTMGQTCFAQARIKKLGSLAALQAIPKGGFSRGPASTSAFYPIGGIGTETLTLPECTKIEEFGLAGISDTIRIDSSTSEEEPVKLKKVVLPKCTLVGQSAFTYAHATGGKSTIEEIELPVVNTIHPQAFSSLRSLKQFVTDSAISTIGGSAFYSCEAMTKLLMKNVGDRAPISPGYYCFGYCTALEIADIGHIGTIPNYAFDHCSALKVLALRNDTVGRGENIASLASGNVFQSSGIAAGTGFILVAAVDIPTYQAASGWSNYASQFRALEDYTVDGTITGDLDETKIENIA